MNIKYLSCSIGFIMILAFIFLGFQFGRSSFHMTIFQEQGIPDNDHEAVKHTEKPKNNMEKYGPPLSRAGNLSDTERDGVNKCQSAAGSFLKHSLSLWKLKGGESYLHNSYKGLLKNGSVVVIVGGHKGELADFILKTYHPKTLIIIEPIVGLYYLIKTRFLNQPSVFVHNIALGSKTGKHFLKIRGKNGVDSSLFHLERKGDRKNLEEVNVVNTTEFFRVIGVGYYDVDLLIIDCEGCEYEVLEGITQTSLLGYFKLIQFQIHCPKYFHLSIKNAHSRYCEIVERLKRTHSASYRFSYYQEMWKRKID